MAPFRLVPTCANVNVSVRVLAYAFFRNGVLRVLTRLSRKSRDLITTHLKAIEYETLTMVVRYSPHLYADDPTKWREPDFEFPPPER